MGKDSLIKSTTTNKAKKDEDTEKAAAKKQTTEKAAAKKSSKTVAEPKKTTTKKKSTAKAAPKKTKTAAKPKPKAAAKPKTKSAAKPKTKPPAKKPVKKLTLKELLHKSFSPILKVPKPLSVTAPKIKTPSAPPFVSASDPKEVERIRGLLLQSHTMADVKAAAKPPVAKEPAVKPQPVAPPTTIITDVPPAAEPEPVSKTAKIIAAGLGFIILLVLMASYNNSSKYYIQPKDNAIEIWKGQFSPKDKEYYMVLHGTQHSGKVKDVYSRAEIFPMVFNYYLGKADTLLEVPGLPDFDGIKEYLHDAEKYAVSEDMRKSVGVRLNNIDRMILLYKADVAISKGTVQSLDAAIKHLTSAQALITSTVQEQEIQQKLSLANSLKAALKAKVTKKGK